MALGNKTAFKDQRTKDKIDLHLRDINDKITEQDIENVQTDVTAGTEESIDKEAAHEADEILAKKQREDKSKEDENNSNSVQTPWNMLD